MEEYSIIKLNMENIGYLERFLKNEMPDTFRYFQKRDISIIQNHKLTILLMKNDEPIGYAHIDEEDNRKWFGICIIKEYQNKGLGKKMMDYIFNLESIKDEEIYLSVDKVNIGAIHLYKKYGFEIIKDNLNYYLMKMN